MRVYRSCPATYSLRESDNGLDGGPNLAATIIEMGGTPQYIAIMAEIWSVLQLYHREGRGLPSEGRDRGSNGLLPNRVTRGEAFQVQPFEIGSGLS